MLYFMNHTQIKLSSCIRAVLVFCKLKIVNFRHRLSLFKSKNKKFVIITNFITLIYHTFITLTIFNTIKFKTELILE